MKIFTWNINGLTDSGLVDHVNALRKESHEKADLYSGTMLRHTKVLKCKKFISIKNWYPKIVTLCPCYLYFTVTQKNKRVECYIFADVDTANSQRDGQRQRSVIMMIISLFNCYCF